ncbi:MAG TPA: ribosomal protein S18-alanine N-acetyltransferase [Pyrinomonadaceae bacterium]|nr:ribosomal protein S18-alanine N-acetyltransferase [Pyrinomonadaceae bacterium]
MSSARLTAEYTHAGFLISQMSEHDLLEVVEIEETCGLSQWGWDAYRTELEKPEAIMLVARGRLPEVLNGRAVAGYVAARVGADEVHVNNIGVRPEARRLGLGGVLLGLALELAERGGARSAVLEVRAGNRAAQALYRRYGFEVAGERRRYYREPVEDALVMTRRLGPKA